MIARRQLIGGAVAISAALPARAQVPGRLYRVGYLGYTTVNTPDDERIERAFVQRLRELGFVEGANLVIEWRFAEGRSERYAEFAAEMVKLGADIVVATSGPAARAVMAASRTMSIVTTGVPDPVRAGLVVSLARPGGQLTGISNLANELVPKRLELIKAAVPSAERVAIARCPGCLLGSGASAAEVSDVHAGQAAAARSLGVKLLPLDVNAPADFDAATAILRRERADALLIGATPVNVALRGQWLAFAAQQRLPMLAPYRGFEALLSYGPDYAAIYRKAAEYVARILGGAHAGELPMEQPTRFEFVINLKLAKAMGVAIPQAVLLRADEVIQ